MKAIVVNFIKHHPGWAMYIAGLVSLSIGILLKHGLATALFVAGFTLIMAALAYSIRIS